MRRGIKHPRTQIWEWKEKIENILQKLQFVPDGDGKYRRADFPGYFSVGEYRASHYRDGRLYVFDLTPVQLPRYIEQHLAWEAERKL
jgi:hypothetical protein